MTGSTSLENIEAEGAKPRGFDTYSECVDQVLDGTVDAMTTDGAILLGYAAENPDELKVVVRAVLRGAVRRRLLQGRTRRCASGSTTPSRQSYEDGTWEEAFRPPSARPASRPRSRPSSTPASLQPDLMGGQRTAPRPGPQPPESGGGDAWRTSSSNFDLVLDAFWLTSSCSSSPAWSRWSSAPCSAAMRVGPVARAAQARRRLRHVVRNTPLLIDLHLHLQRRPDARLARRTRRSSSRACIALTLYTSAFVCEAVRSGINSVPLGQAEAARADRHDLRPVDAAGGAAAGLPRGRAAAGQRAHRAGQEHLRRGGLRHRRGDRAGCGASPTTTPTTGC